MVDGLRTTRKFYLHFPVMERIRKGSRKYMVVGGSVLNGGGGVVKVLETDWR